MINQIHFVKTKTEALPTINKGLLQARHIQARLHEQNHASSNSSGATWSHFTAGPYLVPISRWAE